MEKLYTPPVTDPVAEAVSSLGLLKAQKKYKIWKRLIWFSLVGMSIPILIDVFGFAVGFSNSMENLGENGDSFNLLSIQKNLLSPLCSSIILTFSLTTLFVAITKVRKFKMLKNNC